MVSLDPKLLSEYTGLTSAQRVGGVNPFAPAERTSFTGETKKGLNLEQYDMAKVPVVVGNGNDEQTSKIGEKYFNTPYLLA